MKKGTKRGKEAKKKGWKNYKEKESRRRKRR